MATVNNPIVIMAILQLSSSTPLLLSLAHPSTRQRPHGFNWGWFELYSPPPGFYVYLQYGWLLHDKHWLCIDNYIAITWLKDDELLATIICCLMYIYLTIASKACKLIWNQDLDNQVIVKKQVIWSQMTLHDIDVTLMWHFFLRRLIFGHAPWTSHGVLWFGKYRPPNPQEVTHLHEIDNPTIPT